MAAIVMMFITNFLNISQLVQKLLEWRNRHMNRQTWWYH